MLPETQMSGVHNLVMTNNSSICIALLFFISHVSVYICNLHILEYTQFYLHIAGLHSLGNGHNWGECERALASFPGLPCFFVLRFAFIGGRAHVKRGRPVNTCHVNDAESLPS